MSEALRSEPELHCCSRLENASCNFGEKFGRRAMSKLLSVFRYYEPRGAELTVEMKERVRIRLNLHSLYYIAATTDTIRRTLAAVSILLALSVIEIGVA